MPGPGHGRMRVMWLGVVLYLILLAAVLHFVDRLAAQTVPEESGD